MKRRHTMSRLLSLLCCVAMLLPCVPATLAAGPGDGTLMEDFESYKDRDELKTVWKQMGNAEIDQKALAHTEAIILSMTPYERENPKVLGASRKKRIAAGCGLEVVDVNRLLKQYEMMSELIKQMTRGKNPFGGMGGKMGGFGAMGRMHGFGKRKRFK